MRPDRLPVVRASDPLEVWPGGSRVVMLVPGEDAIGLDFEMPPRVRRGRADRIAFHAVQDLVGEDMAELHMVRLPRDGRATPSRGGAVVTSRARMLAWRERAEEAGVHLAAILPDYLALPWTPGSWTVCARPGRWVVRCGRLDGFAAEPELGVRILERRLRDAAAAPERIRLLGEEAPPHAAHLRLGEAKVAVEREALPETAPSFRHGELDANLIAGPFSESFGVMQEVARWRLPAALAAAALLVWGLDHGLALWQARAEIESLDRRIEELVRAELVPHGPIVDVRTQAERSLQALRERSAAARDAGGFLALIAASDEALASAGRRVSQLSWREGVLTTEVTVESFGALEALGAELAKQALAVTVESSSASGGEGVQATLAIRPRTDERSR